MQLSDLVKQAMSHSNSVGCNLPNFVKTRGNPTGRIQSTSLDRLTLQVGEEPVRKMVNKLHRGRSDAWMRVGTARPVGISLHILQVSTVVTCGKWDSPVDF